jgi:hypothetical protein
MAISEPTILETWRGSYNNSILSTTNLAWHQRLMLNIHKTLINEGTQDVAWDTVPTGIWTVDYMADSLVAGTKGDGIDRWDAIGDLQWDREGDDHAWVVYNAGSGGVQVLINLNNQELISENTVPEYITCYVSSSAGFTGGTLQNRPTATDEFQIASAPFGPASGDQGGHWAGGHTGSPPDVAYQILMSDDGGELRIVMHRGGVNFGIWVIGQTIGGPNAQTDNTFGLIWSQLLSGPEEIGSTLNSADGMFNSGNVNCLWSASVAGHCQPIAVDALGSTNIHSYWDNTDFSGSGNNQDGEQLCAQVGLNSIDATGKPLGYIGRVRDMWMTRNNRTNGDTFPADGSRRFVKAGEMYLIAWQPPAASGGADPGVIPNFGP